MAYRIKKVRKKKIYRCSECGIRILETEVTYVATQRFCKNCFHYHSQQVNRGSR